MAFERGALRTHCLLQLLLLLGGQNHRCLLRHGVSLLGERHLHLLDGVGQLYAGLFQLPAVVAHVNISQGHHEQPTLLAYILIHAPT